MPSTGSFKRFEVRDANQRVAPSLIGARTNLLRVWREWQFNILTTAVNHLSCAYDMVEGAVDNKNGLSLSGASITLVSTPLCLPTNAASHCSANITVLTNLGCCQLIRGCFCRDFIGLSQR